MKRKSWVLLAVAAMAMMVLGAGAGPASAATQPKFTVFAAASLYKAFPAMVAPFKARYPQYKNDKFVFNFAGHQRPRGADRERRVGRPLRGRQHQVQRQLLSPTVYLNTPRLFCQNTLCVIVPNVKGHKVNSLADLTTPKVRDRSRHLGHQRRADRHLHADGADQPQLRSRPQQRDLRDRGRQQHPTYGAVVANVNMVTALVVLERGRRRLRLLQRQGGRGEQGPLDPGPDRLPVEPAADLSHRHGQEHRPKPPWAAASSSSCWAPGARTSSRPGASWAAPIPIVSSLSATSGAAGSSVTITGTNFGSNKAGYVPGVVKFGTTVATTTAWTATSITATVPAPRRRLRQRHRDRRWPGLEAVDLHRDPVTVRTRQHRPR